MLKVEVLMVAEALPWMAAVSSCIGIQTAQHTEQHDRVCQQVVGGFTCLVSYVSWPHKQQRPAAHIAGRTHWCSLPG
jgi:hypothetical protein